MQIMALAELGQLEEAVKTMEDGLRDTASSSSRTCTVYSDTVSTRHSFISCRKFVLMDLQQGSELCVQTGFTNLHCLRQHCILFSGSVCCSLGKTDLFIFFNPSTICCHENVHGIPCGGPCLYTGVSVNIPTHHHGCAHTFLTSLKNSMVVVTLMARKKTLSFESVWVTEAGGVLLGV